MAQTPKKSQTISPEQAALEDAEIDALQVSQEAAPEESRVQMQEPEPEALAEEKEQTAPKHGSPQNDARLAMADKMAKKARSGRLSPFTGMTDPRTVFGDAADQLQEGEQPEQSPVEAEAHRRAASGDLEMLARLANGEVPEDQTAPAPPRQSQQLQQESTTENDPFYDVVVDGQPLRVPLSQLVQNYSLGRATEQRLREAGNILAETRAFAQGMRQPMYQPQAPGAPQGAPNVSPQGQQPQRPQTAPNLSEDAARAFQEAITLGDPAEVQQAIGHIVDLARAGNQPTQPQVDPALIVRTTLDEERRRDATARFLQEHETEMNDPYMRRLTEEAVLEEMGQDAKALGLNQQDAQAVSNFLARYARQTGVTAQEAFKGFHNMMRAEGYAQFRDPDTLLRIGFERAAAKVRQLAGVVTPQEQRQQQQQPSFIQERQERKRSSPMQPAMRRSPQIPREEPKPMTASEIIREMNRQRGMLTGEAGPRRRA